MTYHSRTRRGKTPIPKAAAISCWVIFAIFAVLLVLSIVRYLHHPDPAILTGTWALVVAVVCSLITAVGLLAIDGMRAQGPVAPGGTLVVIGVIGAVFTKFFLAFIVIGVLWAAFGLIRMGDKPSYLR